MTVEAAMEWFEQRYAQAEYDINNVNRGDSDKQKEIIEALVYDVKKYVKGGE